MFKNLLYSVLVFDYVVYIYIYWVGFGVVVGDFYIVGMCVSDVRSDDCLFYIVRCKISFSICIRYSNCF